MYSFYSGQQLFSNRQCKSFRAYAPPAIDLICYLLFKNFFLISANEVFPSSHNLYQKNTQDETNFIIRLKHRPPLLMVS
jgi:hypothetical protein